MSDIGQKATKTLKWSSIMEIASKFVSPLMNMIQARILATEALRLEWEVHYDKAG